MKTLLVCVVLSVTVCTVQQTIGQRDQEPEALQGGANQEVVGHVIVMVASGWTTWPKLPQCETDAKGRFTNKPCMYGGERFPKASVPEIVPTYEPEEFPAWLWQVSR